MVPQDRVEIINKFGGQMQAAIGIPGEMLRDASKLAVCKINQGSDLRVAFTSEIRKIFVEQPREFEIRKYTAPAKKVVREMIEERLENVFMSAGHAVEGK